MSRAWLEQQTARGLCRTCSNSVNGTFTHCFVCRKKDAIRAKARRAQQTMDRNQHGSKCNHTIRAALMQQCENVMDRQYDRILHKLYDQHSTLERGQDVAHTNRRVEWLGDSLSLWDLVREEIRR